MKTFLELEQLYERRYPRFLRVAAASLGNEERGRDAVHEAFVLAVSSTGDFRGECSLETWVWRILTNVCHSERRRSPELPANAEERSQVPNDADWPEVRAAVAGLPERQRTVLFLRYFADLDYEQIAATLGIERGTVAATLHAAHTKLREVLLEVWR